MVDPAPIEEMRTPDAAAWAACQSRYKPLVFRALVADWPAVAKGRESPEAMCQYLAALDNGHDADVLMVPPDAGGRIGYGKDGGFNYLRNRLPITRVLEQIARYSQFAHAPAVAMQSALVQECLPDFAKRNVLPLVDVDAAPRIWIGNAITTPAHIDESRNVACVVAGRRRFTLFPPDQAANLYLGPVDYTPTGSPVSLVDSRAPDFARYPRYREALAAAQVSILEPGDAIYIPPLWWHQVESLEPLNVLVNYWWKDEALRDMGGSVFDGLLHSLLMMRNMPAEQRNAWRTIFDHYLFHMPGNPAAHLDPSRRGVLGNSSPALDAEIRAWLINRLNSAPAQKR